MGGFTILYSIASFATSPMKMLTECSARSVVKESSCIGGGAEGVLLKFGILDPR